jgi:hypothetical protein
MKLDPNWVRREGTSHTPSMPEPQVSATLSREDLLLLQLKSGCAPGTIRNYFRGRARGASVRRIEQALAELSRERATPPAPVPDAPPASRPSQ